MNIDRELDARGLNCPLPILRTKKSLNEMSSGQVLRVLATGASRRAMAQQLSVSEHTIRHHLEHIYAKLDVRTRVEATLFALEHNLVD